MKFYIATILLAALGVQTLAKELAGVPFKDAIENNTENSRPGKRIIGGNIARVGLIPYQAALQTFVDGSNSYRMCGGSLIAINWIATAAHCVSGAKKVTVRLGSINYDSGGKRLDVKNIYIHPQYNRPARLSNDIAILKLSSNAALSSNIKIIKIAHTALPLHTVRASGWGKTSDSGQTSPVLKYADLKIMNTNECVYFYVLGLVTADTICTYNIKDTTCHGDSGGPLVDITTKQLVGITSFTSKKGCSTKSPSGYVKIANYRPWIRQITRLNI